MKIQSQSHTYTVVAKIRNGPRRTNLLARNDQGVYCLLLTIDDPEIIRELAPMFIVFKENGAFSHFIESFPFDGGVYAVFAHTAVSRDLPIYRALAGTLPIERVQSMRSLLGILLEQDMPSAVICDVLRPGNLLCSPDGTVKPIYNLMLDIKYNCDRKDKVQIMLAEIVREIFTDIAVPSLSRFISALEALAFDNIVEIYAAFAEIADEVAAAQVTVKNKLSLREWLDMVVAKLTGNFLTALAALVLAAGMMLLCYLFFGTVISPQPVDNEITEIGTVEVHDDKKP